MKFFVSGKIKNVLVDLGYNKDIFVVIEAHETKKPIDYDKIVKEVVGRV